MKIYKYSSTRLYIYISCLFFYFFENLLNCRVHIRLVQSKLKQHIIYWTKCIKQSRLVQAKPGGWWYKQIENFVPDSIMQWSNKHVARESMSPLVYIAWSVPTPCVKAPPPFHLFDPSVLSSSVFLSFSHPSLLFSCWLFWNSSLFHVCYSEILRSVINFHFLYSSINLKLKESMGQMNYCVLTDTTLTTPIPAKLSSAVKDDYRQLENFPFKQ